MAFIASQPSPEVAEGLYSLVTHVSTEPETHGAILAKLTGRGHRRDNGSTSRQRHMAPTAAEDRIREKLMIALEPTRLDVINESELHAGHRNSPGTGESHFRLVIVSPKFSGRTRLERHRLVNEALAGEMGRIHALAIAAFAPDETLRV